VAKPHPEYPLTPYHGAKQWCKKIRGRVCYFGSLHDPNGALERYNQQAGDLHAGRTPRPSTDGLTVRDLCNHFLNTKQALVQTGELAARTWGEYKETCALLVGAFGKPRLVSDLGPTDFAALRKKMSQRRGPVRLDNAIQRVRSVFKFATDNGLLNRAPPFGQGFQRPSAKVLRLHKAAQRLRLFTREEVLALVDGAMVVGENGPELAKPDHQLRAMLLLAINGGLGCHDCALLPLKALDLENGWLDYPRPKTGVRRRIPLWEETVVALQESIAHRPAPRQEEAAHLVFLTTRGRPWLSRGIANPISVADRAWMKQLSIGRPGLGFYSLRHVYRTVSDGAKDPVACDHIMGHSRDDMASVYRERIDDARLEAVTDHVHDWLFGQARVDTKSGTTVQ
jgi:integrase